MPGLSHFLIIGAALFCIGMYGALTRRNAVALLMAIELMLNAFVVQRVWRAAGAFTILGVAIAFVASVGVFLQVQAGARGEWNFPWLTLAPGGRAAIELGLAVDQLTAVMLLAVTGVSLLV